MSSPASDSRQEGCNKLFVQTNRALNESVDTTTKSIAETNMKLILRKRADVLVLEFNLNDYEVARTDAGGAAAVRRATEAVARRALEASAALAVVVLEVPNGKEPADRASMLFFAGLLANICIYVSFVMSPHDDAVALACY